MRLIWLKAAVAGAAIASGAQPARAAVDAGLVQAAELDRQGKAAQAYALLAPQVATRAQDADFNYAFGLVAIDAGRTAEAILAFQRVLALQPHNAEARAELARAYALAGDVDTARAQFDTVLQDPSLPDPVRQRFTAMVRGLSRQITGKGSDVTGFAELAGGGDSNINTATSLSSVTIPLFALFGPSTLSGAARASRDSFIDGQAGVSGVYGVNRTDRAFASVIAGYHGNLGSRNFNQANATASFGYAHGLANHDSVSLSGQAQQFWLGDVSYRQAYGAIAQYTHALSGGRALSFSGQFFRFHYASQPLLNANRYAAGISYAARAFVVSGSVGREKTLQAAGDNQSNLFGDLNLAAELPLADHLSFVGGASAGLRRYEAADPLFLVTRSDERIDLSAGLKIALSDHLAVRPRATFTRNFSNIAIYDFSRWTSSIGARFEF